MRQPVPDAAAVIVFDRYGRVLLLQRGRTAPWRPLEWNLPGGVIDPGETPKQAAVREAQEEANITPVRLCSVGVWAHWEGWVLEVFVARSYRGRVKASWESERYAWVNPRKLSSLTLVPFVHDAIMAATR